MRRFFRFIWHVLTLSRRLLIYLAVVLSAYLLQVCVMPYLRIGGVAPSLCFAVAAVITVCYGRMRAYWTGAIFGILTEATLPTVQYFNLLLYPIVTLFAAVFFSDKNEKRLEEERSRGREGRNGNVYLRTLGDAALCMVLNETINIVYMYLGGAPVTAGSVGRALIAIVYTTAIAAVIMVPLRRILGFHHPRRLREAAPRGRYLAGV